MARDGEPLENTNNVTMRGDTAIIPIAGTLFRHAEMFDQVSAARSYTAIRKDFEAALENDNVKAIVFDVDSPGGEVHGASELSRAIFSARGRKSITAYVSGVCASAAYWIASAADTIVADPTAMVGSIGVRTMMTDDSKRDEAQGIKEYNIVSTQSPKKIVDPASSADRARVQEGLTQMAQVFVSDVARNRSTDEETVLADYGQGDVLIGEHAVNAGLIDSLGDFESTIAALTAPAVEANTKRKRGGKLMAKANHSHTPAKVEATAEAAAAAKMAGTCAECDDDIDEDEDMYCKSCYGKEGDSDAKALLALCGASTVSEAVGVISALKAKAEQSEKVSAELAQIKAASEQTEIDALIASLEPGKRDEAKKLSADFGVSALKAFSSVFKGEAKAAPVEKTPETAKASAESIAPEMKAILAATGLTIEQFHEQAKKQAEVRRAYLSQSEEV